MRREDSEAQDLLVFPSSLEEGLGEEVSSRSTKIYATIIAS